MFMFDIVRRVDAKDPLPRHAQVQRILREMVLTGQLKPGDKIPAELQIADALGVSKMTVNKALLALTASGMLVREVGRGTFVSDNPLSSNDGENGNHRSVPRRPRIVLSFIEGAKNVLDGDYHGTLYRGVREVLESEDNDVGVDVVLSPLATRDYLAEDERDPADGLLIFAPRAESIPSIEALWRRGKAVLVVGASWPSLVVPSLDSDNIGGAVDAVEHLVRLGHKRIALFYACEENANTQDRIAGYRRALSMAGLPYDDRLEVLGEQIWHAGDAAKRRLSDLLFGDAPVTGIFAAGHYMALEAKNVIREAGLRVPEDVSVVGYDDPISAQLVYPPLTTIRQPLFEMGRRAAERLLRLVRGDEPRSIIREMLPGQLIVRRSTGPAPSPNP
jgi:GntR family transcriptional regulator, arabinose operon transcriptional repressor